MHIRTLSRCLSSLTPCYTVFHLPCVCLCFQLCTDDKLWRDRIMREARTLILDDLTDVQALYQHQRHQITMTVRNPRLDEPRLQ